jgi:hypothetical protein
VTTIIQGIFYPGEPLYDSFNGHRYPTYTCAFCAGGFREKNGRGIAWVAHGFLCCSEPCARMLPEKQEDHPRFFDVTY